MTDENSLSNREPSLGGEHAPRLTSNEPALSMDYLLPGLRDAFTSENRNTRTDIIDALTTNAQTAAPVLIQLLRGSADSKTRQRSAAILGQMRDERAVPILIEVLTDPDANIRKVAVWALGQIGSVNAVDPLLGLLERESEGRIMRAALQSLAQIGDIKAWRGLVTLCESDDADIAAAAFSAARTLGRSCTVQLYVDLLHDENPTLRTWAAEWATINETIGIEHLALIERLITYEQRADVRRSGIALLAQIDSPQARIRLLELTRTADEHLRMACIRALSRQRTPDVIDLLLERYHHETEKNQSAIIEAIGTADDPRIIPFLLDRIETAEHSWVAIQQVLSRPEPDLDQLLLDRLRNASGESRQWLIRQLSYFDTARVNDTLWDIIRSSTVEEERRTAISEMHLYHFPDGIAELAALLVQETSDEIRSQILWTLGRVDDVNIDSILRDFLASIEVDTLRVDALSVLLSREVPDGRELLNEYVDRIADEDALTSLVQHLDWLGEEPRFQKLLSLYDSAKTVELRRRVVDEFEHFQHPEELSFLRRVIKADPSAWVRSTAVWNIYYGVPSTDESLTVLIEALNDEATSEAPHLTESWRVCDAAADCLERLIQYEPRFREAAEAALTEWRGRQGSSQSVE